MFKCENQVADQDIHGPICVRTAGVVVQSTHIYRVPMKGQVLCLGWGDTVSQTKSTSVSTCRKQGLEGDISRPSWATLLGRLVGVGRVEWGLLLVTHCLV